MQSVRNPIASASCRRPILLTVLPLLLLGSTLCNPLAAQELDSLLSEVRRPHFDQLPGMMKRHQVRILVHWSKTDYFIDRGEQHGIMWELARDFEKFLNKELRTGKRPIACVIVPVSRDKLVTYLEEGLGEISLDGMHETPELKGRVTFSAPFTRDVAEIIMRNANAPPVRSDADLGGRTIHLRPTSKYASTMGSVNRRLRERGLPEATIIPLSEHLADADIIELMNAGLIEYTVLDQYRGDFWASVFPQVVAEHQHPLAEHLPLRFLLRNDTPRLKVLLDKFIASHGVGTEYGNTLVRRYFKTNPRARRAMGPAELDRFRTTVEIFRKYASKYGFDHLMLTAQGFQESGLNQSVRSAAGAVGVMQVMPSTGKAMRVGDIHKVEPNIHAGVKYMDRLASTYFNDPDLDELNRTLLCFAAYNAGPTRINSFRREATRRRLDPNRWFDHVERIAAERGLRETVQYVVNITKYSVAYRLLEEDAANREAAKRAVKTHAP